MSAVYVHWLQPGEDCLNCDFYDLGIALIYLGLAQLNDFTLTPRFRRGRL